MLVVVCRLLFVVVCSSLLFVNVGCCLLFVVSVVVDTRSLYVLCCLCIVYYLSLFGVMCLLDCC